LFFRKIVRIKFTLKKISRGYNFDIGCRNINYSQTRLAEKSYVKICKYLLRIFAKYLLQVLLMRLQKFNKFLHKLWQQSLPVSAIKINSFIGSRRNFNRQKKRYIIDLIETMHLLFYKKGYNKEKIHLSKDRASTSRRKINDVYMKAITICL